MKINYHKLGKKHLSIAKQVTRKLQANNDVIGVAVFGSTASGDVHRFSDVDLLVLVKGAGIFKWKRRTTRNVTVNIATRSRDVLEKMSRDHPDTIFALQNALILYDPKGIVYLLKRNAVVREPVHRELLGDLLDEARSYIGKSEKALAQNRMESSIICLRQGAAKLAEYMLYKKERKRVNPMYLWEEIHTCQLPDDVRRLFAEVHGFRAVKKGTLSMILERMRDLINY